MSEDTETVQDDDQDLEGHSYKQKGPPITTIQGNQEDGEEDVEAHGTPKTMPPTLFKGRQEDDPAQQ